jgi:anti-sigma B factor antagonist
VFQGTKEIALNLGALNYIDSAGLGELISAHSTITRNGGHVKIFNLTKRVSDLLAITKVLTVFDVYDSEQEALNSFPQVAP